MRQRSRSATFYETIFDHDERTFFNSSILRAAEPIFEEGLVFARYLAEAAEGFFRFMLGRRVTEIVATAYLETDHDLSYQNVTFAEQDHVIVGMALAYTAEQHHRSSDQPLKKAAGCQVIRLMCVKVCCAPLWRILDTIQEGDFYLQAIAVEKDFRGLGVGSIMMGSIEERAITSGSVRISLDVAAKNESARRLYERRGMTVESQWPKRLNLPRFRFLRMSKIL
jgi:ribosomal protein S18 acetylase RimI-like enzyme